MLTLLVFMEGILAFVSPCVLPLLPTYLIYLAGDNKDDMSSEKARYIHRLRNTIAFVLGFSLLFVALGAVATSVGSFLLSHKKLVSIISALFILVLALSYSGLLRLPKLGNKVQKDRNISISSNPIMGFVQSFLFGIFFATTWTPCIGTFLASAMTMAASLESVYEGMLLLFVFALGLGLPFILVSLLYEKIKTHLSFLKTHSVLIRKISAGILFLLAIYTLIPVFK